MVNLDPAVAEFQQLFHAAPQSAVFAPGRVNLIGEHVDYNDGLVLPIAIERGVRALVAVTGGRTVALHSREMNDLAAIDLDRPAEGSGGDWKALAAGVLVELARAGLKPTGANVYLWSDLPIGAGLASSAAFETAVACAALAASGRALDPAQVAAICRAAEHRYAGVPCGIMDQLVCARASRDCALLIDCRDGSTCDIPWPADDCHIFVIDSRSRRRLDASDYAARVEQCRQALAIIRQIAPAVGSLRDVAPGQLERARGRLGPLLHRRARHVVSEIARTASAAEALRAEKLADLGRLMDESHASLRDDYEVSSEQLDRLVQVVRAVPSVFGARLTGAGFGGCVVALAPPQAAAEIEAALATDYNPVYGAAAEVRSTRPGPGAGIMRLATP